MWLKSEIEVAFAPVQLQVAIRYPAKDSPCLSFVKLICRGQMQRKILIFLCVVTWIVIFFVWRTLFWTRAYDTTNMQVLFTCYRLAYKRWLTSIDWNWFEGQEFRVTPHNGEDNEKLLGVQVWLRIVWDQTELFPFKLIQCNFSNWN